jgi:hypothetical protein
MLDGLRPVITGIVLSLGGALCGAPRGSTL